jgi:alpha-beta hydrolase superfamily lysophospholipase
LETTGQPGSRAGRHHRGRDGGDLVPDPERRRAAGRLLALLRAPLAALAILAGIGLIGGCAYLTDARQGELIFRPTKDAWWGFDRERYTFEDHWIAVGDGQKLHAWWLTGDRRDAPAVLYLHGARWNLTGSVTRIDRWRQLGFAVLAVDYRGFGESSDATPTEAVAYEDAEAAWDYLAKLAPGRPRYVVGHSLGGAIATELARRHPEAAGLVLEATFTSVADMIGESPWGFLPVSLILTQKFDTLAKIGEVRVPVIVAHGTRDSVVPFTMGERLYAAARAPKRFVRVEGAGHHNLSGAGLEQYRAALAELFGLRAKPS